MLRKFKKFQLVVHVGVHGTTQAITLEKCAYGAGYCRPDFEGKCLPCDRITLENNCVCEKLETTLNVEKFTKELNLGVEKQSFCCSFDPGKYGIPKNVVYFRYF
jgi:hypothetical protein